MDNELSPFMHRAELWVNEGHFADEEQQLKQILAGSSLTQHITRELIHYCLLHLVVASALMCPRDREYPAIGEVQSFVRSKLTNPGNMIELCATLVEMPVRTRNENIQDTRRGIDNLRWLLEENE